jgi:hypothetical protein
VKCFISKGIRTSFQQTPALPPVKILPAVSLKLFDLFRVYATNSKKAMTMKIKPVVALIALGISAAALAAEPDLSKLPPASDRKDVMFEKDIKPIFDNSCVKCHGAEKPKGKLRLDSLEGVLKGGQDGKVVEPGNSAKSMLVLNIAHLGDVDDFMPPPKNRLGIKELTPEQIGLVRAWIDQGAK